MAKKKRRKPTEPEASSLEGLRAEFNDLSQHMREAFALWELWSLAARDKDLLSRLGKSFAGRAFEQVRHSLYRSLVLALSRMWDRDPRSLSIPRMAGQVGGEPLREILIRQRIRAYDMIEQLRLIDPELTEEQLLSLREHQDAGQKLAFDEADEELVDLVGKVSCDRLLVVFKLFAISE